MDLNGAHWPLLVNHLPISGGLLATIVLGYGLFRNNLSVVQLGFGLFVRMSLLTFTTNQRGMRAEYYFKSINALHRPLFRKHEEAADSANVSVYMPGILSLLTLSWQRAKQRRFLPSLVFIPSLITFRLMATVGRLGGLIMHRELLTCKPVRPFPAGKCPGLTTRITKPVGPLRKSI